MSEAIPARSWHCLPPAAAAQALATGLRHGLAAEEAARRLASGGRNVLCEAPPRPAWRMLLDQFRDFMIVMLLAAALVSGAIGEVVDSLAIVAILVVNACIGFVQEYRAAQAMQALKRLAAAHAKVLRGQMGLALAVRSERRSLASIGLFSNPALAGAVALTVALQFLVVYLPAANAVFRTEALRATEMLLCMAAGLSVLLALELNKWRIRRA